MRPLAFVLSLLPLFLSAGVRGAPPGLRVRTDAGLVEGRMEGAVRAFLGIPYAAPPIGPLRWRPPAPAVPWKGVRPAKEFGHRPWQPAIYADMIFRDPGPSEDCLTLNVWTPPNAHRLPVMVWIFGGGLIAGGTSELRQDGAHLAARGVVVVSMNYRLGVLGFLTHPELAAESPHHAAGNYGILDQLAALQWVRSNIERFGGDPGNVTLFGESAGSMSTSMHMASPLARGLFHRAIGESGSIFGLRSDIVVRSLADAEAEDGAFLARRTGRTSLSDLRALPARELVAAVGSRRGETDYRFRWVIDGYVLPRPIAAIFAAHQQNDVPLLAGWTRDEGGKALAPYPPTLAGLKELSAIEFPGHEPEFLRWYAAPDEASAAEVSGAYAGDRFKAWETWRWVEAQHATGRAPVYCYRFDRAPPANFFGVPSGVYHSADILYVFNQFAAHSRVRWTDADRAVSEQVQAYWVNFARVGDPNGPGLARWPRYSAASDWRVMHLDATSAARPSTTRGRYLFLQRVWER